MGVFTFSPEEETPAYTLPNQVPQEVMETRREILMQVQQPISLAKNQKSVGQIIDVLIEQEHPETGEFIGRSTRFAPEVDGWVYVQGDAQLGAIVPVEITDAAIYDLYGHVVAARSPQL